ncbi:hypothetical protein [uncultured Pontibacter sp.]|uniref:hypothetical protein n=1 Tax=uncultured Pontibacter sp. TaxID=453356 RepID=UPI00260538E8|nr:hypothetical protein [uncultured Pontibacter sp.]
MTNDIVKNSDYSDYLTQLLGRRPSPAELISFENNQNLILINRRSPENNAYHISFANGTAVQLLTDGVMQGGSIELHSHEAGHRFYSVQFEEQDAVEEHYLILDAAVESVRIGESSTTLVQSVRLITIEDLVLQHDPIMYSLPN